MPASKRHDLVEGSMPPAISIVLHLLVFGLILYIPWAVKHEPKNRGLVIAATQLEQGGQEVQFEEAREDEKQEEQEILPEDQDWAKKPTENLVKELMDRSNTKDTVIALGAGGSPGGAPDVGESAADKIKISAGSQGPKFFGVGGAETQAKRIVYVVDRSGSMINTFDELRAELKSSIDRLTYTQSFHIIFFSNDKPEENPPRRLVRSIRVNKQAAFEFLDTITPEGKTDPTAAMRRAFEVKPDIIFFLTDGEFDPDLLEHLRKWNKSKKVSIFTYAYVFQPGKALLERIAREHGGQYKYISEHDIL